MRLLEQEKSNDEKKQAERQAKIDAKHELALQENALKA